MVELLYHTSLNELGINRLLFQEAHYHYKLIVNRIRLKFHLK